jgi:hypothetical protein
MRKVTKPVVDFIARQLNDYIQDRKEEADEHKDPKHKYHSLYNMILDDAAYAQDVLDKFEQHRQLNILFDELMRQDTLPREDCFSWIVDKKPEEAKKHGLSWDLINTIA